MFRTSTARIAGAFPDARFSRGVPTPQRVTDASISRVHNTGCALAIESSAPHATKTSVRAAIRRVMVRRRVVSSDMRLASHYGCHGSA